MKDIINKCDLYILVWVIHLVHDYWGLYGSTMSVGVLFCLYAWSLYYCYVTVTKYKMPSFLKIWTVLFVLFSIYALIRMFNPMGLSYKIGFEISSRMYLIEHWTSMLPIYPFYVFSKTGQLNKTVIKRWALVLIGVAIIQYNYGQVIAYAKIASLSEDSGFTNNQGYFIAMVLPLMFLWNEKPIIQYVGIAILMFYVLMAVKRGAIIVAFLCLFIQLLSSLKSFNKRKSVIIILAVATLCILGYNFIINLLSTNEYFAYRFENSLEGDTSGRDSLYSSLFSAFLNNSNFFQLLIGWGADGTVLLMQQQAHNDWLEVLIDLGIVGIVVFVVFWIRAFITCWRFENKELKVLFLMVIIMLFVRTFFSMSINDMYISSTVVLGYCLANSENKSSKIHHYVKTDNSIQNI